VVGGAFRFQLRRAVAVFRFIEFGARCDPHLAAPYGDQALFGGAALRRSAGSRCRDGGLDLVLA
jgi:hypothetical protein